MIIRHAMIFVTMYMTAMQLDSTLQYIVVYSIEAAGRPCLVSVLFGNNRKWSSWSPVQLEQKQGLIEVKDILKKCSFTLPRSISSPSGLLLHFLSPSTPLSSFSLPLSPLSSFSLLSPLSFSLLFLSPSQPTYTSPALSHLERVKERAAWRRECLQCSLYPVFSGALCIP